MPAEQERQERGPLRSSPTFLRTTTGERATTSSSSSTTCATSNFFDFNNSQQDPYIAGFFSSTFNEYLKRNVMTIDAFDWEHRTGSNPPNEPAPRRRLPQRKRPTRSSTRASSRTSTSTSSRATKTPTRATATNEGLSDYAGRITGYFDTLNADHRDRITRATSSAT